MEKRKKLLTCIELMLVGLSDDIYYYHCPDKIEYWLNAQRNLAEDIAYLMLNKKEHEELIEHLEKFAGEAEREKSGKKENEDD